MKKLAVICLLAIAIVAVVLIARTLTSPGEPAGEAPAPQPEAAAETQPHAPVQAEAPVSEPAEAEAVAVAEPEAEPPSDEPGEGESSETPEEESVAVRFYGTVLDAATDAPVSGATVGHELRGQEKETAQTDASGAFSLDVSEIAPMQAVEIEGMGEMAGMGDVIVCRADGYARASRKAPADWSPEVRMDFLLHPGSGVSGMVTGADTGEGIPGAKVSVANVQQGFLEQVAKTFRKAGEVTTQDDGTYTVGHLGPGAYKVVVSARSQGYTFTPGDALTLNVEQGMMYENVDFVVEPGAVVTGVVKGAAGDGVSGAHVELRPTQLIEHVYSGFESLIDMADLKSDTDDEGQFEIAGLDFDTDYRLSAKAEGHAETLSAVFQVSRDASPARVDIVLSPGSEVSGTARHADGRPAKNYKLLLFPDFGELMTGAFTEPKPEKTDETGAFVFDSVPAGKFTLMDGEGPPQFNPFAKKGETVTVEVDGIHDITGLEFTLAEKAAKTKPKPPATGAIEGRVFDESGAPVAKVRVAAEQCEDSTFSSGAVTAEDGTFVVKHLRDGRYDLSVNSDLGDGRVENVAVGAKVTIHLAPPAGVSGQVVDKDGAAADDCTVQLKSQQADTTDIDPETFMVNMLGGAGGGEATDENGFFEFKKVEPGEYTIKAKSYTKGAGQHGPITVQAGQSLTGLRITLEPGVSFSGTVEDSAGNAIQGASVTLIRFDKDDLAGQISQFMPDGMQRKEGSATSDADGSFEMANIVAGAYMLKASHTDYAGAVHKDIEVQAGHDVTQYRVVLSEGGSAGGQLLTGGGEPRPGVMIQLMGTSGMKMATTDSEGSFHISGITPGTYIVQAVDMGSMMSEGMSGALGRQLTVEIVDGEYTEIDFAPPAGTVTVAGTIAGELGSMTIVTLRSEGGLAPEELDPTDFDAQMEQAQYQAGTAFAGEDGVFEMEGVEPGTYILEVMSMDFDPAKPDIGAMMNMDRTPAIRQEVVVEEGQPLVLDLELPPR